MKNKALRIVIITIILAVVAGIIAVISAYLADNSVRSWIDENIFHKEVLEEKATTIDISLDRTGTVFAYDNKIGVLKDSKFTIYDSNGVEGNSNTIDISNPIYDVNTKYVILGEEGADSVYLIKEDKIAWNKKVNGKIKRVTVNKNGYSGLILTGTTDKSEIKIYNPDGEEEFTIHLSQTIAMDIDISPDNKNLIYGEIDTSGTTIKSNIKLLSIEKAKNNPSEAEIKNFAGNTGDLIMNVKLKDDSTASAMFDNSVYIINGNSFESIMKFNDKTENINLVSIDLKDHVIKVHEDTTLLNNKSKIEMINVGSKQSKLYIVDGIAKEIYANGDVVAVNLGLEVHFIDTSGWLLKKYISSKEINSISVSDGIAAIVYNNKIVVIKL